MSFFEIIKLIFPLFLMVGLLYGVMLLIKKYSPKSNKISSSNLRVLSTLSLMPKKYISVVKVNNKVLILGVSEQSINLLQEAAAEDFNISDEEVGELNPNFRDLFNKMMPK